MAERAVLEERAVAVVDQGVGAPEGPEAGERAGPEPGDLGDPILVLPVEVRRIAMTAATAAASGRNGSVTVGFDAPWSSDLERLQDGEVTYVATFRGKPVGDGVRVRRVLSIVKGEETTADRSAVLTIPQWAGGVDQHERFVRAILGDVHAVLVAKVGLDADPRLRLSIDFASGTFGDLAFYPGQLSFDLTARAEDPAGETNPEGAFFDLGTETLQPCPFPGCFGPEFHEGPHETAEPE